MSKTREIEKSEEIGEACEVDDSGNVAEVEKMLNFSMALIALDEDYERLFDTRLRFYEWFLLKAVTLLMKSCKEGSWLKETHRRW